MSEPTDVRLPIDESDQRELLRIARITLKEWLKTGRTPPGAPHRASLLQHAPAFVTINVDGRLRGCIGHTDPETPLYKTIVDLTIAAATRDPRFHPVRLEELAQAKITVSVLSARSPVADVEEIEVGKHGLLITLGPQRGLLLPQVPVEHGWSRETFLEELCYKAGLEEGAWKDPEARLEKFSAEVFSEA